MTAEIEHLVDTPEALLAPGRERLAQMRQLADFMVYAFGKPYEDSRSFMWQAGETTYLLGRGGHWQDITGQAPTDENWLYVQTPEEEGITGTSHLISDRNTMLASNESQREEVARILQQGMAQQLLGLAGEMFPPQGSQPGVGSLRYDGFFYHFRTFTHASVVPFVFVDCNWRRYEISPDAIFRPLLPNLPPLDDTPLNGSVEGRLHLLARVLIEGREIDTYPRSSTRIVQAAERQAAGWQLSPEEIGAASAAIEQVRSWCHKKDLPPALERLHKDQWYAIRTVIPDGGDGQPAAVGMVAQDTSWVVETITLGPDGMRETIGIDTKLKTAYGRQFGQGQETAIHGSEAHNRAQEVLDLVEMSLRDGTLVPCPQEETSRFRNFILHRTSGR